MLGEDVGVEAERLTVLLNGLREFLHVRVGRAQVHVEGGGAGIALEGLPVVLDGFPEPVFHEISGPKIVPGFGEIGPALGRFLVGFSGGAVVHVQLVGDAELVPQVGARALLT